MHRPLPPDVSDSKLHNLLLLKARLKPPQASPAPIAEARPTEWAEPSRTRSVRPPARRPETHTPPGPEPSRAVQRLVRPSPPTSRAVRPPVPPLPEKREAPQTLPPLAAPPPPQPSRAVPPPAPPSRAMPPSQATRSVIPPRPVLSAEPPRQPQTMPPGPVSRSLRANDPKAPEAPRSSEGHAKLGAVALRLQSVPVSRQVHAASTRERKLVGPLSRGASVEEATSDEVKTPGRPSRDTRKQPELHLEIEARDQAIRHPEPEPRSTPTPSRPRSIKTPTPDDELLGMRVGNARIVARIGHGGMGAVYRAEHQVLRTPYAVKILHRQLSRDRRVVERFRREALACSRLQHPNVVFVTDFGYKKNLGLYIIMEYLEGRSLAELVFQDKDLAVERIINIGTQIADALHAAHKLGIIHRDLKSENIQLVQRGDQNDFVKVLDFGIARLRAASSQLTAAGMVLGSPHYMSPEQIQGFKDKVGPTSDIYALGIIFYEMLTGDVPFDAEDPIEVCKRHLRELPPRISAFRPELRNTRLDSLVARMLEKEPEHRPKTMKEVVQALKSAQRELRRLGLIRDDAEHGDVSQLGAQATARRMAIARTMEKLRTAHPRSPLVEALIPLGGLERLPQETFRLMLWGVLERELVEAPLMGDRMRVALLQLGTLVGMALEDEDSSPLSSSWFNALGSFIHRLDRQRQEMLISALNAFSTHPRMPPGILPGWAGVQASGSWMPLSRDDDNSQDEALLSMISSGTMLALRDPDEDILDIDIDIDDTSMGDEKTSLIDKLRRPVSVKTVKSVLNHDISNLWRRKDLEQMVLQAQEEDPSP